MFPLERHSATLGDEGTLTLSTPMPVAVALFAEGCLAPVGGPPVDVLVYGQALGPMVLREVSCGSDERMTYLVFEPT
ncbi:MAG: hypothetical protein CMN30_05390 [Sandaracinus sp.]|nr:hypothetical protein [Sandaracinus sp.]